ncbi:MAG TPA: hypothetical protein PLJ10_06695 [Candidatus Hydrogenedens sp.]|nr:hypothetical protein [Candidatus Hydrogenedens sp.]
MLKNIKPSHILIICGLILSLSLSFYLYVYSSFSKATGYKYFVQDNTVGYVITQPSHIQAYIRKLAPSATRWIKQVPRFTSLQPVPIRLDWFHNLPREASLVFHYIPSMGFETRFIIREKRNSSAFIEELHASHFVKELRFIQWKSHQFANIQRDIWLNEGFIYGKPPYAQDVSIQTYTLPLQNNHLVEIFWLNTDQNLSILLDQIYQSFPSLLRNYLIDWQTAIENIYWIHSTLDLKEDNLCQGVLNIQATNPIKIDEIRQGVQSFNEWLQSQLPSSMKFELTEENNFETLTWNIRFYDFEPQLKRALGNFSNE